MSSIPKDIIAKRGDEVLPKWRALLKFIANTGIVVGPGVKVTTGPNGTYVDADSAFRPWSHPFKVSCDGATARVRAGLVNGISPYIADVRISGVDIKGANVDVPPLVIDHDGTPITYVALVVVTPESTVSGGEIVLTDSPKTIFIAHVTSLSRKFSGGGSPLESAPSGSPVPLDKAIYPLASLYLESKCVLLKKTQIVHHNLGHRYIQSQAKAGIPGRHLFWAA